MAHIHDRPGQHDLTISAFIARLDLAEPRVLLHRHKSLGTLLQIGGHVELHEQPWAAVLHEVVEESGYEPGQLSVLQPPDRFQSGHALVHPQPICVRTHRFGHLDHFHTDLAYALLVDSEPAREPGNGESLDLRWLARRELMAGLHDDAAPDDVRDVYVFLLDHIVNTWEPVPATAFAIADPA